MKILIACEFSGILREEFKKRGHDVLSCDLLPTEIPGNHYQGNVLDLINDFWDMMIAFPPCTYLTVTANRHFINNPERWQKRLNSMLFVYKLLNADIEKICLENPVGVISSHIRPPDQILQPYEFGDSYKKTTCLWLKGLYRLCPTNIVMPTFYKYNSKKTKTGYSKYSLFGKLGKNKGKERSVMPNGLAVAMAEQWGY